MSLPASSNRSGGSYRKPRADLYTVLLALALIAILLGILCLYFEMKAYDFKFKGFQGAAPAPADLPGIAAMPDVRSAARPSQRTASRDPRLLTGLFF